jgi:methylglutaconyl-CoA hydratase
MSYKNILFSIEGRVATLKLNRPDIRNAFNAEMILELTTVFKQLEKSADVSVLMISGEGKSFCSGADLSYMKEMASFSLVENMKDARVLDEMYWALRACPQAVVGRIHGHAMGGALGLTALCDIAAAVEGTQFCFSENRLGLVPAVISPYVLEKMNAGAARRFMLSAEVFTVWAAADAGLIEYAGNEADVDLFLAGVVKALSENGPESIQVTKQLLRRLALQTDWNLKREMTTKAIAEKRVRKEGQEGLKSFLAKRAPSWKSSGKPTT